MKDVFILDGAIGSNLFARTKVTGQVWTLNMENPEAVKTLYSDFVKAGSDFIGANTFTVNPFTIKETNYNMEEVIQTGINLAKEVVKGTNTKVCYDVGPLPDLLEPYGDLSVEDCKEIYKQMISAAVVSKPDAIFFETFTDLNMLCCALEVASTFDLPIYCCLTFETHGKTMMGNSVADMVEKCSAYPITALGLNCSSEASTLFPILKEFREKTNLPLIFKPNAGMPTLVDGKAVYNIDEKTFVETMKTVVKEGNIYVGGCCGTTPEMIALIAKIVGDMFPVSDDKH